MRLSSVLSVERVESGVFVCVCVSSASLFADDFEVCFFASSVARRRLECVSSLHRCSQTSRVCFASRVLADDLTVRRKRL